MGGDADQPLLEEIARLGNGRSYVADDPAQVPQIFAKETVTASKSAINEQPFPPTVIRATQVFRRDPARRGPVPARAMSSPGPSPRPRSSWPPSRETRSWPGGATAWA